MISHNISLKLETTCDTGAFHRSHFLAYITQVCQSLDCQNNERIQQIPAEHFTLHQSAF